MNAKSILGGAFAGAALMYFGDPRSGRRRRAVLRDKTAVGLVSGAKMAGRTARDFKNRWQGLMAVMTPSGPELLVSDDLLAQRVRSALGRVVSHPKAVDVMVRDGYVTLYGPILLDEAVKALNKVRCIRGVRGVNNRLESQKRAGNEPALQGGRPRAELSEFVQTNWSPTMRLVGMVSGWGLTFLGLQRRSLPGTAVALAGMGLSLRSIANVSLVREMKVLAEYELRKAA